MLIGVNHIATMSNDLDRLVDFYERIFGAQKVADLEIPPMGARHVFITLGGPTVLHAWQVKDLDVAQLDGEIFNRGRVDHFALQTDAYEKFEELRHRLIREGTTAGEVNDFGVLLTFSFVDPDGLWTEVAWWKDGMEAAEIDMSKLVDPIPTLGTPREVGAVADAS